MLLGSPFSFKVQLLFSSAPLHGFQTPQEVVLFKYQENCLFQPLGNALPSYSQLFWSFWEKKREKPRRRRALQEYQAQESNDCMLISHDEKPSSSKDFLNFPLTITQAKMRPTPIIFSNKQLSKIIPRVLLQSTQFCPSYFLFMHIPIIINVPRTVRKAAGLPTLLQPRYIYRILVQHRTLQGCSENLASFPDVLTDKTLSLRPAVPIFLYLCTIL